MTLLCSFAWAQNKNIKINPKKPLRIEYKSPAWNRSSHEIDHDAIVLRDSSSGKLVRIELAETGEDTGVFVGDYSVYWGGEDFHPEVYIVPHEMFKSAEQMKKINEMIAEGTLVKKPIFFQTGNKMQKISVFDTREQAIAAYEEFRRTRLQGKPPIAREDLEAQAKAEKLAAQRKAEAEAAAAAQARMTLEQQEKEKQAAAKAAQEQLATAEKEKRQEQAQIKADEAMLAYGKKDYQTANSLFSEAVELDPSNSTFYYQYGVTLYKTENYNKSIVILNLSQGADVSETEKKYYLALNHIKLGEQDQALPQLDEIKKTDDKLMAPSASFYAGIIRYQKEDYDASKANFEYVLDHSQDPAMDRQAESYIEQIANVMSFQREASKRFILTLNAGLTYDSNILLVSSATSSNSPTGLDGYRWSYGASLEYRPIYTQTHELSAILSLSDMYSEDKNFQPSSSFQETDPLDMSVALPYHYKGQAFGHAYQMGLTPTFETIHMNYDGTGGRELITQSQILRNDHTFAMSEDWFSTYMIELRHDQSLIDPVTSADNLTDNRVTVSTYQTFFVDTKKTQAWIGNFAIGENKAEGDNQTYDRFDLGATYYAPAWWNMTWTGGLAYFYANYPKATVSRKDNDFTMMLGLTKNLTEKLSVNLTGNYIINNSTDPNYDYKKYTILGGLTWVGAF